MTRDTCFDIIIVGAGPAGLFCAVTAGADRKRVLLLDKNTGPGKKLLLAGSGQCNITHDGPVKEFLTHYGDHGAFLKPALMNFSNTALITFFEERGLGMTTTKTGKVFPATLRSGDVLQILENECRTAGVTTHYSNPVMEISSKSDQFSVVTRNANFSGKSLVICTGGASYPGTGSTGDGYRLAASLGHTITETAPALSPVIIDKYPFCELAGVSFDSLVFSVWRDGKKTGSHKGDLLFTHQGLSGPGILDYSRFIRPGDILRLSFVGPVRKEQFVKEISEKIVTHPVSHVKTVVLYYKVPERLATLLLYLSGITENLTCAHLTKEKRNVLISNMVEFPLKVGKLGGFNEAMVTRGGVFLPEINPKTMESRLVPGLYFAGEIIDIDGDTGGYNLQAAFSTGFLAAKSIIRQ
jgi:predicted Rossmann fold flavoprotein